MLMAAGFAMLESGLVRTKNTAAICLKNMALYSVAGLMFYIIGYNLMYTDVASGVESSGRFPSFEPASSLLYVPSESWSLVEATLFAIVSLGQPNLPGFLAQYSVSVRP